MTRGCGLSPTSGAGRTTATGTSPSNAGMFRHADGGSALVFQVAPTKVFEFAKGRFAQTRYRFHRPRPTRDRWIRSLPGRTRSRPCRARRPRLHFPETPLPPVTPVLTALTQPSGCHTVATQRLLLMEAHMAFPDCIERTVDIPRPPAAVWAAL